MRNSLRYLLIASLALCSTLAWADHRGYNKGWNRTGFRDGGSNWSVNINLGSTYAGRGNAFGRSWNGYHPSVNGRIFNSSLGYISLDGLRYNGYYNQRPVIIQQNTYIRQNTPVNIRSGSRLERSLLRDRYGRCYEREFDRFGNERRIELPASACNY